jgi:alpha-beta hydrolase superfamily lysophospholipase
MKAFTTVSSLLLAAGLTGATLIGIQSSTTPTAPTTPTAAPTIAAQTRQADAWDVRYRTVKVDGLDIFYREAGPKDAPTILLLHGFLDHAGSWARVAERLSGHVVALDLRGHGRSAWVGPGASYHFPEYVADVDALHRAWSQVGIPEQGIPRLTPPRDEDWGLRMFALVDPNGSLLRCMAPRPETDV